MAIYTGEPTTTTPTRYIVMTAGNAGMRWGVYRRVAVVRLTEEAARAGVRPKRIDARDRAIDAIVSVEERQNVGPIALRHAHKHGWDTVPPKGARCAYSTAVRAAMEMAAELDGVA